MVRQGPVVLRIQPPDITQWTVTVRYAGADPGGRVGCLVTPLWVTLSTRTIKHAIQSQGNCAKQKTVRQCTRCLSSKGMEIQLEYWHIIMCFVWEGPRPLSTLPSSICMVLLSHPRSKISGSATDISQLVSEGV